MLWIIEEEVEVLRPRRLLVDLVNILSSSWKWGLYLYSQRRHPHAARMMSCTRLPKNRVLNSLSWTTPSVLTCSRPARAPVKGSTNRCSRLNLWLAKLRKIVERTLLYVGGGTCALRSSRRRIPALSYWQLSHKSDPSWTVGTCTTRTGGHTAPYQPTNFPRSVWEFTVAALVVTRFSISYIPTIIVIIYMFNVIDSLSIYILS